MDPPAMYVVRPEVPTIIGGLSGAEERFVTSAGAGAGDVDEERAFPEEQGVDRVAGEGGESTSHAETGFYAPSRDDVKATTR
jgi:hypothetical protein